MRGEQWYSGKGNQIGGRGKRKLRSVGVVLSPVHQPEKSLIMIPSGKMFSQEETFAYFTVVGQMVKSNSFLDVEF